MEIASLPPSPPQISSILPATTTTLTLNEDNGARQRSISRSRSMSAVPFGDDVAAGAGNVPRRGGVGAPKKLFHGREVAMRRSASIAKDGKGKGKAEPGMPVSKRASGMGKKFQLRFLALKLIYSCRQLRERVASSRRIALRWSLRLPPRTDDALLSQFLVRRL